jgi:hypothetical protein
MEAMSRVGGITYDNASDLIEELLERYGSTEAGDRRPQIRQGRVREGCCAMRQRQRLRVAVSERHGY